jgi:cell division protein FtsW (lipid II flippase)
LESSLEYAVLITASNNSWDFWCEDHVWVLKGGNMIIHMLMRMLYWKVYPDVIVCLFVVVIVLFVFSPWLGRKEILKTQEMNI